MTDSHGFLSALVTKRDGTRKQLACMKHNLLTQDGRDVMHQRCYILTTMSGSGFNYIASTESTITPAATDTALTGEIAVNGLARAQATGALNHTDNSNSSTVEHTFTASGSFTDVKASATFNAATGVTMGHIANFATGSGTLISGDTLKITWTLNLG
jgi:hypothetical protein